MKIILFLKGLLSALIFFRLFVGLKFKLSQFLMRFFIDEKVILRRI